MGCCESKVSKFTGQSPSSSNKKIENMLLHNELYSKQCKRKSEEYDRKRVTFNLMTKPEKN